MTTTYPFASADAYRDGVKHNASNPAALLAMVVNDLSAALAPLALDLQTLEEGNISDDQKARLLHGALHQVQIAYVIRDGLLLYANEAALEHRSAQE